MRKVAIILLMSFSVSSGFTQETDLWHVLADVKFESKTKDELEIDSPIFGKRVQSYHGKKITLKGYLVPLSEFGGKDEYMLSALPLNACFFCGGAGPETVVELKVKQSVKFTEGRIAMTGTLMLNTSDPDHHIYILKDATVID